jgi:hypothetical protein
MASIINASTSGVGGVITTADNSGDLNIQSGGSTKIAVTSAGVAVTGLSKASLPTGSVLQVVSTQVVARSFSTSSTSYVDITGLSATITPISATSKILVSGVVSCGLSTATEIINLAISRNGTIVGSGNEGNIVSETRSDARAYAFPIQYLDSPASTSAQTYTLQTKTNGGAYTFYLNRRGASDQYNGASVITLMEIAA